MLNKLKTEGKLFLLFLLGVNLIRAVFSGYDLFRSWQLLSLALLIIVLLHLYKNKKQLILEFKNIRITTVPKTVKILVCIIFMVEIYCMCSGETYYPFADVGMFKEARHKKADNKVYIKPFYYFFKNDKLMPIDIRKEHTFQRDYLDWTYNNEYTFSANYHYKSTAENFIFLKNALIEKNILEKQDTIYIGLRSYNFDTGETTIEIDSRKAIDILKFEKQYYGALYVPKNLLK